MRTLDAVTFYNVLLPQETGEKVEKKNEAISNEMKEFLMIEFGTTKVQEVDFEALK